MRSAGLAMLALLVVGCESFSVPRHEPPLDPGIEDAGAWQRAPNDEARRVGQPRPLPPRPKPRPELPWIEPKRLTGLTPKEAERLLGQPDERSDEPPAVVWTYLEGPCRLELFFYYDLESQQQRSLTFDLAPGSDAEGARAYCFAELARRGAMAQRLESVEEQLPGAAENAASDTKADTQGDVESSSGSEAESDAGGDAGSDAESGEEAKDSE